MALGQAMGSNWSEGAACGWRGELDRNISYEIVCKLIQLTSSSELHICHFDGGSVACASSTQQLGAKFLRLAQIAGVI